MQICPTVSFFHFFCCIILNQNCCNMKDSMMYTIVPCIAALFVATTLWMVNSYNDKMTLEAFRPVEVVVLSGHQLPTKDVAPGPIDPDPSNPPPIHSKFIFTDNECKPENCTSNSKLPPYLCSGGCLKLTDEQEKFLRSRGNNSKGASCATAS